MRIQLLISLAVTGKYCRFYFESEGIPRQYMDIFAQVSTTTNFQVRFKTLDTSHYHPGYTFDGFSMWHSRLVRRYEMNDGYQYAPDNLWYACAGGTGFYGEYQLVWDSRQDSHSPTYVKGTTGFFGCLKVDIIITAV